MLGQAIKKLRQERGMKQEELGLAVGVSKQSVSNWENDNVLPSIEMLVKMADFFQVSTDYLLGRAPVSPISVDGLTEEQQVHLKSVIRDLKNANQGVYGE